MDLINKLNGEILDLHNASEILEDRIIERDARSLSGMHNLLREMHKSLGGMCRLQRYKHHHHHPDIPGDS
jgi:hypothetical protein